MKIEFDYILEDHGWAIGRIAARGFQTEFDASYLHDSLDSIIQAGIGLLTCKNKVIIPFFSEPGEHQIVIEKINNSRIELELRWYDDWATWNMIAIDDCKTLFKGETTLKSFIENAYDAARKILDENVLEGYLEKWRGNFPIEDFKKLEKLKNTNAQPRL